MKTKTNTLIAIFFVISLTLGCTENSQKGLSSEIKKVNEEQSRKTLSGEKLELNFFEAGIEMGNQMNLVKKIFPGADVKMSDMSTELVDAYNVKNNNKEYCVLVSTKAKGESFVINKVFVMKGKCSQNCYDNISIE